MRQIIIGILFSICFISIKGQGIIQGYIINIEDNKAYLDVTSPKVNVGDVLSVYSDAGYMIHPVTKKKIKKEGSIIADLEVIEVNNEYSVATIYPEEAIKKLKVGMIAQMPELTAEMKEMMAKEREEEQAREMEAVSDNPENFTTAEQVLQWHLKSTGLDKVAANPPRSYLIEFMETVTNKKGKIKFTMHVTRIVDIPTKRIYIKVESASFKAFSPIVTVVANGIGRVKMGKLKERKIKEKKIIELVENIDIVKEYIYNTDVICTLCENEIIDGKSCIGIEINHIGREDNVKSYIDKETGLLVLKCKYDYYTHIEDHIHFSVRPRRIQIEEKVTEYRQFGDYLLPSVMQAELKRGDYRKTEILQFIPNYPVNDSYFTKEALSRL